MYLAHENVRKNNINIFTNWGEFVVNEKDFFAFLEKEGVYFETHTTRFNPSITANQAEIATAWEDGEPFKVWRRPYVPVFVAATHTMVCTIIKTLRIEQ
jgi:hypothetical protein